MTAAPPPRLLDRPELTFADIAQMIERAVRDKSYRRTPLGQLVGRYFRELVAADLCLLGRRP